MGALAKLLPILARLGGGAMRMGGRVAGKVGAGKTGSRLLRRGYAAGRRALPRGSKARSFFRGAGQSAKAAEAAAPSQAGAAVAEAIQSATSTAAGSLATRERGDPDRDIVLGGSPEQPSPERETSGERSDTGTSTSRKTSGGGAARVEKQTTIKERIIERVKGAFGGKGTTGEEAATMASMSGRKHAIRRQQIIEENSGELATMSGEDQDKFIAEKEDEADNEYSESSQERAEAAEEAGNSIKEMAGKVSKYAAVVVGVTAATYGALEAVKHFGQYLVQANEHLKEYSGVVASSMAEYRMHTRHMEMNRAAKMGGVIQEFTQTQMEFEKALQPIENVIDAAVMNITETLMEVVMYPVTWLTSTAVWKWCERRLGVDSNATASSQILDFWQKAADEGNKDRWID